MGLKGQDSKDNMQIIEGRTLKSCKSDFYVPSSDVLTYNVYHVHVCVCVQLCVFY